MANIIGALNLFQDNSNRPNSPVRRGFGAASSKPTADTAKISFTSGRAENRPAHSSMAGNIAEMRERQAALRAERAELARQMENAREAADAQAEYMRLLLLALRIAARIMRGDNVPQVDKDFLLEQNPGMYMLAMAARNMNNDDPKDYDALARGEGAPRTAAGDFGQMQAVIPDIAAATVSPSL